MELLVMREREREIDRLQLLKKRLLKKNESHSLTLNRSSLNPEHIVSSSRNDQSLVSLSNVNHKLTNRKRSLNLIGYLENKKDRSGVIRFINGIKENKNHKGLRSISELRNGGQRRFLNLDDDKKEVKKINIIGEYDKYEKLKIEEA